MIFQMSQIGSAKFVFIPYVLHQLRQFRDIVMKMRRYNNSFTWNYRYFCFYILIQVSNHHICIYMYIVSGNTQSYIVKNCIGFNRAYIDNRSQKKYVSLKVGEEQNIIKLTDLCYLYYMFGFLRFTECYVV